MCVCVSYLLSVLSALSTRHATSQQHNQAQLQFHFAFVFSQSIPVTQLPCPSPPPSLTHVKLTVERQSRQPDRLHGSAY